MVTEKSGQYKLLTIRSLDNNTALDIIVPKKEKNNK